MNDCLLPPQKQIRRVMFHCHSGHWRPTIVEPLRGRGQDIQVARFKIQNSPIRAAKGVLSMRYQAMLLRH